MPDRTYPVESLLRPVSEYYAVIVYGSCAAIALLAPEALMVIEPVGYAFAAGFAVRGAQRYRQARKIRRYQKQLWKIDDYALPSQKIPISKKKLFLGRGFAWKRRHVQRLNEVENEPVYSEPGRLYRAARQFEISHEHTPVLRHLAALIGSTHWLNPLKPLPPVGGQPALHAVGMLEGEQDLYLDQAERNGHSLILGTTRVGKTRFLSVMVRQDIANGDVVIVFDPKGDGELFRDMYAEAVRCNRIDDFYFFHLGYPEACARYNPVGNFSRVTEIASRISSQLPGSGQSQAFREFVWRYVNVIAKALTALGRKASYEQIKFYGEDIEPLFIDYLRFHLEQINHRNGAWQAEVAANEQGFTRKEDGFKPGRMGDRSAKALALNRYYRDHGVGEYDVIAHSLIKTFEYEKGYLDKLVGSLLPLMEKLCTGKTAELLSPNYSDHNDPRPIFDWPEVIRTGGIVYVGLDALADPEVASAVGNSMFADLTAVSGQIYKSGVNVGLPTGQVDRKVNIHADEFNELIGDQFIPLVNKAGGAGFQVSAYTQTWSDIEARVDNIAKAGQVAGNFNNLFMLRVLEQKTAEMMTRRLKQVEIAQLTTISATNDSSNPDDQAHFTSRTEQRITTQRVDLIHPNDLTTLPKGQAFCLLDGGKPYKLRIPLPVPTDLADIPEEYADIANDMIKRYTSSESWASFESSILPMERD